MVHQESTETDVEGSKFGMTYQRWWDLHLTNSRYEWL